MTESTEANELSNAETAATSDAKCFLDVSIKFNNEKAYDLTPFNPDENGFFLAPEDPQENDSADSNIFATDNSTCIAGESEEVKDSQEVINKREQDGLLQSENCEAQMARIAMYYTRVEDSESDDSSVEEGGNDDVEKEKVEQYEVQESYEGLDDQLEECETATSELMDDAVKIENGLVSLVGSLQFSGEPEEEESTPVQQEGFADEDEFNLVRSDENNLEGVTATADETEGASMPPKSLPSSPINQDEQMDSFSNAVPLLNPPPVEKMQAYLISKGLVGVTPSNAADDRSSPSNGAKSDDHNSHGFALNETAAFEAFATFDDN